MNITIQAFLVDEEKVVKDYGAARKLVQSGVVAINGLEVVDECQFVWPGDKVRLPSAKGDVVLTGRDFPWSKRPPLNC